MVLVSERARERERDREDREGEERGVSRTENCIILSEIFFFMFIFLKYLFFIAHYAITDISPRHGSYSGGTVITILGENFEEASNPICLYSFRFFFLFPLFPFSVLFSSS
jgi:hypothetical protein